MFIIETLFFVALFAIIYTYVLYPVLLLIISAAAQLFSDCRFLISKHDRRIENRCANKPLPSNADKSAPSIAVIIAAYNEEKSIYERIENLLKQTELPSNISIYIGSDGSDDQTIEIANRFYDDHDVDSSNLHIFDFQERRGKVSVLNELVDLAKEDILVFSDANTLFADDAIAKLLRHFNEPDIGAVVGELVLYDPVKQGNQDSAYWQYERLLKFHESRLNGLLGANGAIYAIRKTLYQPLKTTTLIDDFSIVMNICRQGEKVHYDPEAIAFEEVSPTVGSEFGRRVRIGAGNYQAMMEYVDFLNPKMGFRCFAFLSHKVLRWLVPHCMLLVFLSNALLMWSHPVYVVLFACQLSLYSLCLLMHYALRQWRAPTLIQLIYFMVSMNAALGLGFIQHIKGHSSGTWKRTAR